MTGTTPRGTGNEQQASRWIREMFSRVAPRYDLANHVLSMNIDRSWRRKTVAAVSDILNRPGARVVDLCCGTGDLTMALSEARNAPVLGSDFCHPMLVAAVRKTPAPFFEADALALPLADQSIDLITCAFGFRNLVNYDAGLREFRRVLRSGGRLAVLEFSHPPNRTLARLYSFYSSQILPRLGGYLSGAPDAYTYLPESVTRFPDVEELRQRMESAGFSEVTFERMTGGIVALHLGNV